MLALNPGTVYLFQGLNPGTVWIWLIKFPLLPHPVPGGKEVSFESGIS